MTSRSSFGPRLRLGDFDLGFLGILFYHRIGHPVRFGPPAGDRTRTLGAEHAIANRACLPVPARGDILEGVEGFGPSTCRLVGGCSVPLSYTPFKSASPSVTSGMRQNR